MKIGLFIVGTKGLNVLNNIVNKYDIEFVLTYHDKNTIDKSSEEIQDVCKQHGIIWYNGKHIPNEMYDEVDKIFVIGWQFLLEKLEKLVIIHDSYLPEYKGWAPTVNYLINRSSYLAVTAFIPTEKMDTGDILYQKKIRIKYPMKIAEAIEIVSKLYVKAINYIIENNPEPFPMAENESFCIWRDEKDYNIDWKMTAVEIQRFVDALGYPYGGARFNVDGETILVKSCKAKEMQIIDQSSHIGKLFSIHDNPIVVCGEGVIELLELETETGEPYKFKRLKKRI